MKELKSHLFICTNSPQIEGRCGHKNAEALRRELKERCKNAPWGRDIRINSSGCLGHCEKGIAAVMYPQTEWFFDLTDKDGDKLFEAIDSSFKS